MIIPLRIRRHGTSTCRLMMAQGAALWENTITSQISCKVAAFHVAHDLNIGRRYEYTNTFIHSTRSKRKTNTRAFNEVYTL